MTFLIRHGCSGIGSAAAGGDDPGDCVIGHAGPCCVHHSDNNRLRQWLANEADLVVASHYAYFGRPVTRNDQVSAAASKQTGNRERGYDMAKQALI
jgi:hypothetical protein